MEAKTNESTNITPKLEPVVYVVEIMSCMETTRGLCQTTRMTAAVVNSTGRRSYLQESYIASL